jgi:hypothetical protein
MRFFLAIPATFQHLPYPTVFRDSPNSSTGTSYTCQSVAISRCPRSGGRSYQLEFQPFAGVAGARPEYFGRLRAAENAVKKCEPRRCVPGLPLRAGEERSSAD